MRPWTPRLFESIVLSLVLSSLPASLSATEFGAAHLVFEKTTKMKKVEASLYMSLLDQSVKNDQPGDARSLRCAVATSGKSGAVPAGGRFIVRLVGEEGSAPWRSRDLTASIDERGEAGFEAGDIQGLVDDADVDGATPELFRIDFDGGKGKKVIQITIDCVHERFEG